MAKHGGWFVAAMAALGMTALGVAACQTTSGQGGGMAGSGSQRPPAASACLPQMTGACQ